MPARIYRPARNAMQSGKANSREWVLEFEPQTPRHIEPLMGYTSSVDMRQQVKLRFDTKEAAVAYAERNGIAYRVYEPQKTERRKMAYADNFRFGRIDMWTH